MNLQFLPAMTRQLVTLCVAMLMSTAVAVAQESADLNSDLTKQPGVVGVEFVFDPGPTPECHASTICETPSGLVAAWFAGTHEKNKDVGIWVSHKHSGAWSDPVEVVDGRQYRKADGEWHRHPCWNPVLARGADDSLLLFYKCGPSPSEWWGMLTRSVDDGVTWSGGVRLPEGIDGPVRNKPIRLPDGRLLCGSSTEYAGWRIHFEITPDDGNTWQRIGPINPGDDVPQGIQPTLLTLKDGTILALNRNRDGQGKILKTTSTDGGIEWSPVEPIELPNPNSGIDAVTLNDGRHLLVYNHTVRSGESPRGREMINVAVSDDDAKTWQAALILENTQRSEFSYPAVIQADDGMVHVTYTWKRKKVRHVTLDADRLKLRPIRDGNWPF